MTTKLRRIALSAKDVPSSAKFFIEAFGMEQVGESRNGAIYLTDGTVNIALLNRKGRPLGWEGEDEFYCIDHFGMWVDNAEEACARVEAAGAVHVMGSKAGDPTSFYEIKYRTPEGTMFDITSSGWQGAVKDVTPAD
jgi:lactoylglutathione lyase